MLNPIKVTATRVGGRKPTSDVAGILSFDIATGDTTGDSCKIWRLGWWVNDFLQD
jgi:hypothetical protein